MSSNTKSFKRRVRDRAERTGESYIVAMRAVQADIVEEVKSEQAPLYFKGLYPGEKVKLLLNDLLRAEIASWGRSDDPEDPNGLILSHFDALRAEGITELDATFESSSLWLLEVDGVEDDRDWGTERPVILPSNVPGAFSDGIEMISCPGLYLDGVALETPIGALQLEALNGTPNLDVDPDDVLVDVDALLAECKAEEIPLPGRPDPQVRPIPETFTVCEDIVAYAQNAAWKNLGAEHRDGVLALAAKYGITVQIVMRPDSEIPSWAADYNVVTDYLFGADDGMTCNVVVTDGTHHSGVYTSDDLDRAVSVAVAHFAQGRMPIPDGANVFYV